MIPPTESARRTRTSHHNRRLSFLCSSVETFRSSGPTLEPMNDDMRDQAAVSLIKISVSFSVESLEVLRNGLRRLLELLPPSSPEKEPELNLEEMDERTELRSVILCVLEDNLRPAIEDLRAAARPRRQAHDA
jgi:hypothetical protein